MSACLWGAPAEVSMRVCVCTCNCVWLVLILCLCVFSSSPLCFHPRSVQGPWPLSQADEWDPSESQRPSHCFGLIVWQNTLVVTGSPNSMSSSEERGRGRRGLMKWRPSSSEQTSWKGSITFLQCAVFAPSFSAFTSNVYLVTEWKGT